MSIFGSSPRRFHPHWWIPLLLSLTFCALSLRSVIFPHQPNFSPPSPHQREPRPQANQPLQKTSLSPTQTDTAANLRAEIARLQKTIHHRERAIASLPPDSGLSPEPERSIVSHFVGPADWRALPPDSPSHSLESVLSAAATGNTLAMESLLYLGEETHEFANALFAVIPADLRTEIGRVESFIAMMTADAVPLKLVRISGVYQSDPLLATVVLQHDAASDNTFRFTEFFTRRETENAPWKIIVPSVAIERYQAKLLGPLTEAETSPSKFVPQEKGPKA